MSDDLHEFVEISCVNHYPAVVMTMKSPIQILKLLFPPDGRQTFRLWTSSFL